MSSRRGTERDTACFVFQGISELSRPRHYSARPDTARHGSAVRRCRMLRSQYAESTLNNFESDKCSEIPFGRQSIRSASGNQCDERRNTASFIYAALQLHLFYSVFSIYFVAKRPFWIGNVAYKFLSPLEDRRLRWLSVKRCYELILPDIKDATTEYVSS